MIQRGQRRGWVQRYANATSGNTNSLCGAVRVRPGFWMEGDDIGTGFAEP